MSNSAGHVGDRGGRGKEVIDLDERVSTAHQKVHVRVVRVVVIDGHPLEVRSQISLHLRHEGPRVRLEIKAIGMLWPLSAAVG